VLACPFEFFNPLWTIWLPWHLDLITFSHKIIAKVLDLSTETYNNEQCSKALGRISDEIRLTWIILVVNSSNAGDSAPRLTLGLCPQTLLRFNNYRLCKDPNPIEHFLLVQMLGNFGKKTKLILYFVFSALFLSKNRSRH